MSTPSTPTRTYSPTAPSSPRIGNISRRDGDSYRLATLDLPMPDLVTMGSSFHWIDRETLLVPWMDSSLVRSRRHHRPQLEVRSCSAVAGQLPGAPGDTAILRKRLPLPGVREVTESTSPANRSGEVEPNRNLRSCRLFRRGLGQQPPLTDGLKDGEFR